MKARGLRGAIPWKDEVDVRRFRSLLIDMERCCPDGARGRFGCSMGEMPIGDWAGGGPAGGRGRLAGAWGACPRGDRVGLAEGVKVGASALSLLLLMGPDRGELDGGGDFDVSLASRPLTDRDPLLEVPVDPVVGAGVVPGGSVFRSEIIF